MQQFSPKQYAAAAVSSPQHSTEKSSFLAPPLTEVLLVSAGNIGTVPFNDTFQGAVPASLALATAAAAQQQALLAALATELRNAIDRWCPVGRRGAAAAAAHVPASRRLLNAGSSVSSSHTSLPRCENGRNKAQLFQRRQQLSFSSAEREQQELVFEEDAPHLADHPVSSSSSSNHDETSYWRCREEAAACPAREFLPYTSECLPAAVSSDGHRSASLNSFIWRKQPRCLYHHSYCATRVILKTAVSLPTHLYREEAAIEEEDAAGLLGCLEDEGMQTNENSDSALFCSTRDIGAILTPSSRDTKDTQETAETSNPMVEHTLQPHTMHGDGSSSVPEEEFSSRWGEWPLRTLSSENIQQFVAPAEYGSSADRSSTATQRSTDSAATEIRSRSGLAFDVRSRVSRLTTGENAGSFSAAAASTSKTHAGLSCCWETPETFFENIPSSKADAQTATSTHQITPADAPAATAPAAAAATVPPAIAPAAAAAENLAGERHRPSCPAPALLPSLAAPPSEELLRPAASELRLPNASAPPPHVQAVELASVATASTDVDASVISLESAAAAAGVNHLNATPPSSSSSFPALRGPRAEKSAVGVPAATDGAAEEQRLRSSWKSSAAKEAALCGGGSSIAAEPTEEDFLVSRQDDSRNSGDGSRVDRARSGPAAATAAAESRNAEVSMLRQRGHGGLRNQRESEYSLNYDDRNAPGVSSDGGDQALSNEREKKTEFVQQEFRRRVHGESEKSTFSCESGDNRRGDGRSVAVVTASCSNDQSNLQAQDSRRVAAEDQGKLIDAGGGDDTGESATKKAASRTSCLVGRRLVTTFEEVGLCITSPCSRSSTMRKEAAADTSGRKEDTTANSYKGRNTIRRKIFVSRSSNAPSVQRSPRAAFSRLGAVRINGKPQFSPRLTQRRRHFSVVADDAGDDFLLKSPTRSTLFCTETTSSSLVRAAGGGVACWGVSADRPLLLPRTTAAAESVFLAAARKHDEDSETQSHVKSHRAAGQPNQRATVMLDPEKNRNTADKSSQRITTSLVEEAIPSPNVQAMPLHVALPTARHAAATADKYVAGDERPSALAAGDICRRQAPETTSDTGRRNSEVCRGSALVMQSGHHSPPESAEQVLLQNPAEAAAAAAAKAAAAAALFRKSVELSSPVVPDGSSPASTTSASTEGVHQFVCAWLEGCCTRLQAIARSSAAAAVLSQQIVEQKQAQTFSRDVSQGLGKTGMPHAILLASKRQVKEELKAYDVAFYRRYGRLPGRPEKEPLRPLYSHYQVLRRLLLTSGTHTQGDLQPRSQKYPLDGMQYCAASSSGSAALNDNCRKHAADEKVEVQAASSLLSTETAGTLVAGSLSVLASGVDATAAGASVPVHPRSENLKCVAGSKGTEFSESDVGLQTCHSLSHEERRRLSITTAGTERADGAAALPVVEWNTLAVGAGSSAESACGGTCETEVCHRVRQSSKNSGPRRRHAVDRVVSEVKPSFTATRGAGNLTSEGSRVEAGSHLQANPQFRSRESLGDEQSRWVQKPNKGTDQPPFGCVSTAFISTQVSGSSSLNDVTVHVRTSRSRTVSAKLESSPGKLSVHSSFGSQAHREFVVSGEKEENLRQELRSNEEGVTKTRPAHEEHSQVIARQSFSNMYAARRRHSEEHCLGESAHAGKNLEKVYANVHREDTRLQSNVRDSSESRDCRTRGVSHYLQQHQHVSVPTPALIDNSTLGDTDGRELAQDLKNQRHMREALPAGRTDTYVESRKHNVDKQTKIVLTSRVNVQAVRKPQPGTALRPRSTDVQSHVESAHKSPLPFLASAVAEYRQRLVRLQQEKRMLRTKLLAYQAEFTAETGRVVQLYKDIAPIEREYRRYKEVKQEIARLTDKQCDTIFPAKESQSPYPVLEEDGIPSEKFDKGRREVCAS